MPVRIASKKIENWRVEPPVCSKKYAGIKGYGRTRQRNATSVFRYIASSGKQPSAGGTGSGSETQRAAENSLVQVVQAAAAKHGEQRFAASASVT